MDVAELGIRVDANGAITVLDKFGHKVDEVAHKTDKLGEMAKKAVEALALMELGHKLLEETIKASDAMTDLDAAVRATGGSAGKTSAELAALADHIQDTTRFSHVAAEQAEALALSFTNISGAQMKEVMTIATNLATRLKMDLPSAMDTVGRALQDPARGLTLLQRSLRLFTEDQIKSIQLMAVSGDTAGAQAAIMKALEARYNGAATAAKDNFGGALASLKNHFDDLLQLDSANTAPIVGIMKSLDDLLVAMKPHMTELITIIYAAAAAWTAYKVAMMTASAVQAGATIASKGGLVGIAIGLIVGLLALRKVSKDTREELEQLTKVLLSKDPQLNKALGITAPDIKPPGTEDTGRKADLAAANEARIRSAKDELELAREQLNLYGLTTDAIDKIKNHQDRVNQDAEATLRRQKQEITDTEEAAIKDANARAEGIRNQAADLRFIKDQLDSVWTSWTDSAANFFRGMLENGKSSAKQLGQALKDSILGALADIMAHKLMSSLLSLITGKENVDLGQQQIQAGAMMLNAAQMMKDAANTIVTGIPSASGSAGGGTPGGAAGNGLSGMQKFAMVSGSALAGYNAGNSIGSGGDTHKIGRVIGGTLSGAAQGAAIGGTIGGPAGAVVGGVIGAVTGFVGSIVGLGSAAHKHKLEIEALQKAYEQFTDDLKVQAGLMTTTDQQIKQLIDSVDAEIKKQQTASGRPYNASSAAAIAQLNNLEQLRIQQLRAEAALVIKLTQESIEARRLRATGNDIEASALELKIQHEREYADAVRQGLDATTLAQLKYVQSLEEQKAAADAFTSSALNIPDGYKIAQQLFSALDPESPTAPIGGGPPPSTDPGNYTPGIPNRGGNTDNGPSEDTPVVINLDGRTIAQSTIGILQRAAAQQFGDTSRWPQADI